jgi:hypothetical protein
MALNGYDKCKKKTSYGISEKRDIMYRCTYKE